MPTLANLFLFLPTMALLVIMPGPDFAMISHVTMTRGKLHGECAAVGIAAGMCVHTALAILGISAIIASSAKLYMTLKYAGAVYLAFIGAKAIIVSFHLSSGGAESSQESMSVQQGALPIHSFCLGLLTNVLNPKAVISFMVLLPQFVASGRPFISQLLILGLISSLLCAAWFVGLVQILIKIRKTFASAKFQRNLARLTGGIFILFGARLALSESW